MVARGAQQIGMRVEMVTRPGRGQNQRGQRRTTLQRVIDNAARDGRIVDILRFSQFRSSGRWLATYPRRASAARVAAGPGNCHQKSVRVDCSLR